MPKTSAPSPEKMETARRIRLCMQHAGMNQRDLARHLGVSDPTVHSWVTGDVTPRPHRLALIGALAGEKLDWMLGREDLNPAISRKLTRLAEILGPERLDYLDELSADELRSMVDEHELRRQRQRRRARRPAETRPKKH